MGIGGPSKAQGWSTEQAPTNRWGISMRSATSSPKSEFPGWHTLMKIMPEGIWLAGASKLHGCPLECPLPPLVAGHATLCPAQGSTTKQSMWEVACLVGGTRSPGHKTPECTECDFLEPFFDPPYLCTQPIVFRHLSTTG